MLLKKILPTRAIALFMAVGFIDLLSTAILHSRGLIVELNPLMRGFINRSDWLFATVKGSTLIAGWVLLAKYGQQHRDFVKRACLVATAAYALVWVVWFSIGSSGLGS